MNVNTLRNALFDTVREKIKCYFVNDDSIYNLKIVSDTIDDNKEEINQVILKVIENITIEQNELNEININNQDIFMLDDQFENEFIELVKKIHSELLDKIDGRIKQLEEKLNDGVQDNDVYVYKDDSDNDAQNNTDENDESNCLFYVKNRGCIFGEEYVRAKNLKQDDLLRYNLPNTSLELSKKIITLYELDFIKNKIDNDDDEFDDDDEYNGRHDTDDLIKSVDENKDIYWIKCNFFGIEFKLTYCNFYEDILNSDCPYLIGLILKNNNNKPIDIKINGGYYKLLPGFDSMLDLYSTNCNKTLLFE